MFCLSKETQDLSCICVAPLATKTNPTGHPNSRIPSSASSIRCACAFFDLKAVHDMAAVARIKHQVSRIYSRTLRAPRSQFRVRSSRSCCSVRSRSEASPPGPTRSLSRRVERAPISSVQPPCERPDRGYPEARWQRDNHLRAMACEHIYHSPVHRCPLSMPNAQRLLRSEGKSTSPTRLCSSGRRLTMAVSGSMSSASQWRTSSF